MTNRRQFVQLGAAAMAGAALPGAAFAQTPAQAWPTRPVRCMIPFAAGSSLDIVGRIVMDPVSSQLGQPIVIENRGGAGGTIGTALVAKSDPDGYTVLIQASAHSAAPAAYSNIGYDVAKDFIAVIPFGTLPNVTVVSPASGIKTLKDLVAKAKAGPITYASAGTGSATHWAAERIRVAGGFQGTHVPFRGGPDALTEVMTGRVDFTSMGMSSALPLIKDGKLVPLAVSTTKRSSALPDVPTTVEAGLPDSDYTYWMGLFVPAKTPEAIVARLRTESEKALKNPNVIEKFAAQGIEPMPMSSADFDALVRKEIDSNIALVKAAGLKFN
jgi:tripartite-type tricarboxylate transporter receptor subunit TctC